MHANHVDTTYTISIYSFIFIAWTPHHTLHYKVFPKTKTKKTRKKKYQVAGPGAPSTTFFPTISDQQSQRLAFFIRLHGRCPAHSLKFCLPTAAPHWSGGGGGSGGVGVVVVVMLPLQLHQYTPLAHELLPWLSVPFTQMLQRPYVCFFTR